VHVSVLKVAHRDSMKCNAVHVSDALNSTRLLVITVSARIHFIQRRHSEVKFLMEFAKFMSKVA
jgi:hypothetical protein